MSFGTFLKERRDALRLKQQEVALEAGIDISKVSRLERDLVREFPSPDELRRLARALETPVEELLEAAGYLDPVEHPVEANPYDAVLRACDDLPDEPVANEVRNMLRRVRDMEAARLRVEQSIEGAEEKRLALG